MTRTTRTARTLWTPLRWPQGWPRRPLDERDDDNFDGDRTLRQAAVELHRELTRKNFARDIALTVDENDGAVAVYFTRAGTPTVLASDRWLSPTGNAWALVLHVRALRGLDRWGVGTTAQAFAGYAALGSGASGATPPPPPPRPAPRAEAPPPPPPRPAPRADRWALDPERNWRKILGFRPSQRINALAIERAWRTLAVANHPDRGGSHRAMCAINAARDAAYAAQRTRGVERAA